MSEIFTIKVGGKVETTVPKGLLSLLQLHEGDEIQIEADEQHVLCVRLYRQRLFSPDILKMLDQEEARIERGEFHRSGAKANAAR